MMKMNTKADRLQARNFYIPKNSVEANYPKLDAVVYTYVSGTKLCAMAFVGTAGKPCFNYSFSSEERRTAHIEKFISEQERKVSYKAKRKEENKGVLTGSAATAKAIRVHLKKVFPEVKFSVTSDNFSGGNSVHIKWTNGPVSSVVELITRQYQYGSFDGMTDCYNYSSVDPSLGCDGAKYVSCSRTQSDERKAELEAHCIERFGRVIEQYADWTRFNAWKYENSERDTWLPKYREMVEAQELKQAEVYEAERQVYLAELKAKEQKPPREAAETLDPVAPIESSREAVKAPCKVLDLTARLNAKRAEAEANKAMEDFEKNYLPFINESERLEMVKATQDEQMPLLMRICRRIDADRRKAERK